MGAWAQDVQIHSAERDGDSELAASLQARQDAEVAALTSGFRKRFSAGHAQQQRNTYSADRLKALAGRVRGAATQDDPDVLRAELADIAATLEALGMGG